MWLFVERFCTFMLGKAVWSSHSTWPIVATTGLVTCGLLHWTCLAGLQRSLSTDSLLHFSRVGSQQHRSQTSAASSEHCTPKHSSFEPGQQLCLLPPQHQARIFQLFRQLCASFGALQPHEPRHWQWPFTSGQSHGSRQMICCIPEPNSQFPEAVVEWITKFKP